MKKILRVFLKKFLKKCLGENYESLFGRFSKYVFAGVPERMHKKTSNGMLGGVSEHFLSENLKEC